MVHYDVLLVTDARLPGGTAASVAEEIRAQAAAGYRTGLIHVGSPLVRGDRPFSPRLRASLARGEFDLVLGGSETTVTAPLVVVRHPRVAESVEPQALPRIRSEHRILLANQALSAGVTRTASTAAPVTPAQHYDPAVATARLTDWLQAPVTWAPIGPLVRRDLARNAPDLALASDDWVNIIDADAWWTPRAAPGAAVPVIGRHSREHPSKWPADRRSLLAAYPAREDVQVRVLGGAGPATALLGGRTPTNWRVWPFGAVPPQRFLTGLDIYVFHHHPAWIEAFGRSILEAMASGLPTILHPRFRCLFEDAATYATEEATWTAVQAFRQDHDGYRTAADRAHGFVRERYGHRTHIARLEGITEPSERRSVATDRRPETGRRPDARRRVLFISSNGAGVGHLMRLLGYAKHAPADVEPLFLTFSQGAKVVHDAGFFVEYLASRPVSGAASADWHRLVCERVSELIERYDVRAVVFDGTWPYQGILDAVDDHRGVKLIWSRRAMWRPGVTNPVLEAADARFDLVIEPGEIAEEADRGATRRHREQATRVDPVTTLSSGELLCREDARSALGIEGDRTVALVHLGAGNIDDTSTVQRLVIDRLAREADVEVRVTRSIITERADTLPRNLHPLSVYPLARYLRAFDLAVAAPGYNSYHEIMLAAVPTVFIANSATATDDQGARSRFAHRAGIGVDLTEADEDTVDVAIRRVLDPEVRRRMRERIEVHRRPNGAPKAMAAIAACLDGEVTTRDRPGTEPVGTVAETAALGAGEAPGGAAGSSEATTPRRAAVPDPPRANQAPRAAIVALSAHPRLRRFSKAFHRLPAPVRRGVRRRLRRWQRAGRPAQAAATTVLPVPSGRTIREHEQTAAGTVTIAVVLPHLGDAAALDTVVQRLEQLQYATGGFSPLVVVADLAFAAARRAGYLVEYIPPRAAHERLASGQAWRDVRRDRLAAIARWYAPDHILHLSASTDGDLEELLDQLASGIESITGHP